MGASALMSLGMRAMTANYAALQTTGHNIANSNTEGYSRQSVAFETAGGQFTGAGFFGKGVNVATIERAHSAFLTREAALTASIAGADNARNEQLQRLEKVFPMGEDGLGYSAQQVFNAFVDVASKPADASSRQVVLARLSEFTGRMNAAAAQVETLQTGVAEELGQNVRIVNGLATRIAALNQDIAKNKGSGQPANDLLDQRDKLVQELGQYVQVSTVNADDGTIGVFIGGGQRLVLGAQASQLATQRDPFDPARVQLGIVDGSNVRQLSTDLLAGGSLAGLLRFQNEDLVDARNRLGQMAAAFAGAVNAQQALGLDGRVPTGQPGRDLVTIGTPLVRPSTANTGTMSVSLAVADASALQPSEYELYQDASLPAGSYRLKRLSDDYVFPTAVTNGSVVDGLRITIGGGAPGASDRFRFQALGQAAATIARATDDPRDIAAAAPVTPTLTAAPNGNGSASIGALSVTAYRSTATPGLTTRITFTTPDASGNPRYTWSVSNGATVLRSSAAPVTLLPGTGIDSSTWTPATPPLPYDWKMTVNGTPASGDVIDVVPTAVTSANNGNANAFLALRDTGIVAQRAVGAGSVGTLNITDAYADALADVGVRVQSAKYAADQSTSIAKEAKTALTNATGVNLDEEAARLIQFQQSYQAAAKMLQVAQSVFDTLLQTASA